MIKNKKNILAKLLSSLVDSIFRPNNIFLVYRQGRAIGEHVAMTAVVKMLADQYDFRIWVITSYPAFFRHNPHVARLIDGRRVPWLLSRILKLLVPFPGKRFGAFSFRSGEFPSWLEYVRASGKPAHIVKLQTKHWCTKLDYGRIEPAVYVTTEESEQARLRTDWPRGSYALIQSEGKTDFTPNKNWGVQRFQKIVDSLPDIQWVQVGTVDETPLTDVADLRGKTTLRELCVLFKEANFVVCQEGLFSHLAAALGIPAVCILTGYSDPIFSDYPAVRSISKTPQVSCSPCWLTTPCPIEGMPCAAGVSAEQIVNEIREMEGGKIF